MTPKDFETDYKSKWGAGFSIAPLFSQSAYFRYKNQDPNCENLFFVGSGTHPGAGLPGVVSSAKGYPYASLVLFKLDRAFSCGKDDADFA
jgi:phytoene desaturase